LVTTGVAGTKSDGGISAPLSVTLAYVTFVPANVPWLTVPAYPATAPKLVLSRTAAGSKRFSETLVNMVRDPVFVMEFIAFGGGLPPAEVASGGHEPDGSRGGEAVEKWW
jgi:hypothetical protein